MLSQYSLKNAGMPRENVSIARNGFEALALTKQQLFDIIIMDINLPWMNGIETAKLIKAQHTLTKIPKIIAYTADENTEVMQDKGAFDELMIKPIKNELFIQKIFSILSNPKSQYQSIV